MDAGENVLPNRPNQRQYERTQSPGIEPIDNTDFLRGLKGASSKELGYIVAAAAHWRNLLKSQSDWDLDFPDAVVAKDLNAADRLDKVLQDLYKSNPSDVDLMAAGLLVWVHTLRAFQWPAEFSKGQEIWIELKRGMPFAHHAALNMEKLSGRRIDARGAEVAPHNLIPDDDEEAAVG